MTLDRREYHFSHEEIEMNRDTGSPSSGFTFVRKAFSKFENHNVELTAWSRSSFSQSREGNEQ